MLKTDYFQLWGVYKSDLSISTAEKYKGIIRIKHCRSERFKVYCWETSIAYRVNLIANFTINKKFLFKNV